MISVVDYDPTWAITFGALKATLEPALVGIAHAVEHVGSTSVPGLAAKPVIDVDVVVAQHDVAEGIARLQALGYQHLGDRGIPLREAFRAPPGTPAHHLYLCPAHSPALANHLALRDYLRADAAAAHAYGELKKRLAAEHARDIDAYVEGKTAFIVSILNELGFTAGSLSDIQRMNQKPRGPGA